MSGSLYNIYIKKGLKLLYPPPHRPQLQLRFAMPCRGVVCVRCHATEACRRVVRPSLARRVVCVCDTVLPSHARDRGVVCVCDAVPPSHARGVVCVCDAVLRTRAGKLVCSSR